jgi:hypothetical protein
MRRSGPHAAHRGPRKPWRTRPRMAAAGAAALFLAGSAMVAMPANAATVPETNTVYASELTASGLVHGQTLRVSAGVADASVETQTFTSAGFTTPGGTPAVTVGGDTNADWAALVLQDAGLPVTPNNLTVMLQWMDSENDPNDWYLRNNPLNNGLGSGGGAGLGSYDDLTTAASYVAQQLTRSDGLFSGIYSALAASSPVSVSAAAIWDSAWAGSHYGYGSIWHGVNVPIVAAPAGDW